jgi:hypothetical protein
MTSAATVFLDKLKGAGIAISNEAILREALSAEVEWQKCFLGWLAQGRARGVTFHVGAAGLNQFGLIDAFVDAQMTGADAKFFLANTREEPAPEVQKGFAARAEG